MFVAREKYSYSFGSDVIFPYIQLSKVDINSRLSSCVLKSADVNKSLGDICVLKDSVTNQAHVN